MHVSYLRASSFIRRGAFEGGGFWDSPLRRRRGVDNGSGLTAAAQQANQRAGARTTGFTVDPENFPVALYVRWLTNADPPMEPMSARLLATALRTVFHRGLTSLGDEHLGRKPFMITGVSEEYRAVAKEGGHVTHKEWKVLYIAADSQPWRGPFIHHANAGQYMHMGTWVHGYMGTWVLHV